MPASFKNSILYSTLVDAIGTTVTVETKDNYIYRGKLDSVDKAGFNIRLNAVLVTSPNGSKDAAMSVEIPGRNQKLVILPETMKFAPRFVNARKGLRITAKKRPGVNKKKAKKTDGSGAKKKDGIAKFGSKQNALNRKKKD